MDDLVKCLEALGTPRVTLVGDFMLDRYVYGEADRISPEAPVPVLRAVRGDSRPGGAGSVAAAVIALGGHAACIGVIGADPPGDELKNMLVAGGADTSSLVRPNGSATIVKSRYVGMAQHKNAQQLLRVDSEAGYVVSDDARLTLRAAVRSGLSQCDVLAIQDHNKGLLTDSSTREMIQDAVSAGVPVVIDPAQAADYRRYRGATLLTPNRFEAARATGIDIVDDETLDRAAAQARLAAEAQAVLVTLDREGMYLRTSAGPGRRIATRPRAVYDVTGAGDVVLAMMALGVGGGLETATAAALANVAGGLEVERFGVVPVRREEVLDEMHRMIGLRGGKMLSRGALGQKVARRRERGETIVMTNGCFDLLHMGHVRYLQQARELGSCLIVAINSDDSARRLKGPSRPIIDQRERAEMLGALECVDYVTVFDEDTPIPLLELLRPDVLVKGGTTDTVVGRDLVEGYGGRVMTLDKVEGLSTTQIIDRIVGRNG
ncbi:MAG: D-glycero-beta-D-manno-heptose 1-phosphate adenylyltransferase [Phycisphaerae bacterium]|nr:D-glycero-beta-D-manno-heptose 1-phosphate adenylyltransferase [Phycisphaerae bacterium]